MKKSKFMFFSIILILSGIYNLYSETRNWEQIYPDMVRPVYDIQYTSNPGVCDLGLMFALPGDEGGLCYFTDPGGMEIFNFSTNLGAVSIQPDDENNRVFCAFGRGSWSDGLYKFDLESNELELVDWFALPNFVKKTSSGFYLGYIYGLAHSALGHVWEPVDYFEGTDVTDVEISSTGSFFASSGSTLYMQTADGFTSYEAGLPINDVYLHNEQVFLALGGGSYSDGVYRVSYNTSEISELTLINFFFQANKLFSYMNQLVVGCSEGAGLFLVDPVENGEYEEIEQDLPVTDVYCFNVYPINTPNFMMGTDAGVYLVIQASSVDSDNQTIPVQEVRLSNYPNPFNPSTLISFSTEQYEQDEQFEILIFNIKGQKIKSLPVISIGAIYGGAERSHTKNDFSVNWDGTDHYSKPVSSGIYYAVLRSGSEVLGKRKMVLLK